MDITNQYQSILTKVQDKHGKFLAKYSSIIDRNTANQQWQKDSTYSKLAFVGKILQDAGVITSYGETDFYSLTRSVLLHIKHPFAGQVYLLNDGNDVFVYGGVDGSELKLISVPQSFMCNSENTKIKKFTNVLQEDFNWGDFTLFVVESIHQTAHKKQNLLEQLLS